MISHVTIGSDDLPRAKRFYDALLPMLGLSCIYQSPRGSSVGYAASPLSYEEDPAVTPQFWLMRPINGAASSVANGGTIAFTARSRAEVDAFYRAALAAGAADEGAPGLRPNYHPNYYGAYVRDLDGHKLCVVCHLPE